MRRGRQMRREGGRGGWHEEGVAGNTSEVELCIDLPEARIAREARPRSCRPFTRRFRVAERPECADDNAVGGRIGVARGRDQATKDLARLGVTAERPVKRREADAALR